MGFLLISSINIHYIDIFVFFIRVDEKEQYTVYRFRFAINCELKSIQLRKYKFSLIS